MQVSIKNRDQAYFSILEKLPEKRRQVYEAIVTYGKCSLKHIAEYLDCERSDISGRVTELKDCFLIVEFDTAKSQRTKNTVTVYRSTTEAERKDLVRKRLIELSGELACLNHSMSLDICDVTKNALKAEIIRLKRRINSLKKTI